MSWAALLELIREEAGDEIADRIEDRARESLAGVRITVCARVPLMADDARKAAPGRPKEAAKILGVQVSTVYRAMRRDRIIR